NHVQPTLGYVFSRLLFLALWCRGSTRGVSESHCERWWTLSLDNFLRHAGLNRPIFVIPGQSRTKRADSQKARSRFLAAFPLQSFHLFAARGAFKIRLGDHASALQFLPLAS